MIGGGYIAKQVNCQRQNVVKSTVRNSSKYYPIPYLDLHIQSVTILCCATSQFHRLRSNVECKCECGGCDLCPGPQWTGVGGSDSVVCPSCFMCRGRSLASYLDI